MRGSLWWSSWSQASQNGLQKIISGPVDSPKQTLKSLIVESHAYDVCMPAITTNYDQLPIQVIDKLHAWDQLDHHEPQLGQTDLIEVPASLQTFVMKQLTEKHPREDYLEFLQLAAYIVGLPMEAKVRRPGAVHRARWMAKALYTLKIELLHKGNEKQIKLTARELASIQRFNRFVIHIYLESWFTCNSVTEAAVNDLKILERLQLYDDKELSKIGLKWLTRHSWYLSPELAALAIFSAQLSCPQKQQLIDNMITERGPHLLTNLPSTVSDLHISRALFETVGIDASFLSVPAENWCETVLHICLKNSQ